MNFPDISTEAYLATDCETHDPFLPTLGTNAIHRAHGGQLLGFSVYVPSGFNEYYHFQKDVPIIEQPAGRWLADMLRKANKVVGANLKYDLLWFLSEKLWTPELAKRRYGDVLINACLLNENERHLINLDSQGPIYGIAPKKNDELLDAGKSLGFYSIDKCKENMHLLSQFFPDVVAAYGRHDSYMTGKVWERQLPVLDAEELTEVDSAWRRDRPHAMPVVELEERFLPLLVLMEAQGIRIDIERAKQISVELEETIEENKKLLGGINYNPSGSLQEYIGKNCPGLAYEMKPKSKKDPTLIPKYKSGAKELAPYKDDPIIKAVLECRRLGKIKGTFVDGYFIKQSVGDRIYPNIYQIAGETEDGEEGGTGTGRQSYSKPNLQNIPSRDPIWGPKLRSLIIAHEGCDMASLDFSQQEPRWAITWAIRWGIPGAREAAQEFIRNPDADWHGQVALLLGGPEWRAAGKVLVLARTYEQGRDLCRANLLAAGVPEGNIESAITGFDAKMGFLKKASKAANNYASQNGFIRTWSGRKRRFVEWEPALSWEQRDLMKQC